MPQSVFHEGADRVIALPENMDWAINNCLAIIRLFIAQKEPTDRPMTLYSDYKLFLDFSHYSVHVDCKEFPLQNKQFNILRVLMENRNNLVMYPELFTKVWGQAYFDSDNNILWNQVKNLNKKLQWNSGLPKYIKNKPKVGYAFAPFRDFV